VEDIIRTAKSKTCSKCETVKNLNEFHKSKTQKDGLQYQCKECINQHSSQYRKENREKIRKYKKQYYQKNLEDIRQCHREYRYAHPEYIQEMHRQYYQKNTEKLRGLQRQYRQENLGKLSDRQKLYLKTESGKASKLKACQKRRAQKLGANIEDFKAQEIFNRDHYICQACGIKTRPDYKNRNHSKYPNLDHIIPLSVGGEHSKRNTQCLCRQCNIKKGNRHANDQMLLIG